ncbi:MAG: hypothetical protein ABSE56_02510 [Bryobacteraceae bacterium]|jgi:hypothetical protein
MRLPVPAGSLTPLQVNRPIAAAVESVQGELEILNGHLAEMLDLLQQFLVLEQLRGQLNEWEWRERLGLPHHRDGRKRNP